MRREWELKESTRYTDFISKKKSSNHKQSFVLQNMWESLIQDWKILRLLKGLKKFQRIVVGDEKSLLELTQDALSRLECIAKDMYLFHILNKL